TEPSQANLTARQKVWQEWARGLMASGYRAVPQCRRSHSRSAQAQNRGPSSSSQDVRAVQGIFWRSAGAGSYRVGRVAHTVSIDFPPTREFQDGMSSEALTFQIGGIHTAILFQTQMHRV